MSVIAADRSTKNPNEGPLVSVITIFFNSERFFREAIESVLAQTYENWELLLVDDGSTDGGTHIARDYASRYPERIRYLEHPQHENRGMSAARNLGLRHARGEWVAFLDADDVWLPPKLENQLRVLDAHPHVEMICGPTKWWYGWTGKSKDRDRDGMRSLRVAGDAVYNPPLLLEKFLVGGTRTPATCSAMIRRTIIEAVGGFEESFRGMYEDQAFFTKILGRAIVYVTNDSWDLYRQHDKSHCAVSDANGPAHWVPENLALQAFSGWLKNYLTDAHPDLVSQLESDQSPFRLNSKMDANCEPDGWRNRQRIMEDWYIELLDQPWVSDCLFNDYAPFEARLRELSGVVLDLGGGVGVTRQYLSPETVYINLEPSPSWQRDGWNRLADRFPIVNTQSNLVRGVGESMPFAPECFDAVLSFWSLNHCDNPAQAVHEVARVLKPGGTFFAVLEDMQPTWGDLLRGAFRTIGGSHAARMGASKVACLVGRKEWPLASDHCRILESDLAEWTGNDLRLIGRNWVDRYLVCEFVKAEARTRRLVATQNVTTPQEWQTQEELQR